MKQKGHEILWVTLLINLFLIVATSQAVAAIATGTVTLDLSGISIGTNISFNGTNNSVFVNLDGSFWPSVHEEDGRVVGSPEHTQVSLPNIATSASVMGANGWASYKDGVLKAYSDVSTPGLFWGGQAKSSSTVYMALTPTTTAIFSLSIPFTASYYAAADNYSWAKASVSADAMLEATSYPLYGDDPWPPPGGMAGGGGGATVPSYWMEYSLDGYSLGDAVSGTLQFSQKLIGGVDYRLMFNVTADMEAYQLGPYVPLPGSLPLLGSGLVGLGFFRRRLGLKR